MTEKLWSDWSKTYYVFDYINAFGHTNNIDDAKNLASLIHAQNMDHYHEVHEKGLGGVNQLEPDDCWKCGRNIHKCECKNLGYSLSICLGNCETNPKIKKQCSNTNCALNHWFGGNK